MTEHTNPLTGEVSRRDALKRGGLLAAAASLGFAGLFAGAEDALAQPRKNNHDRMDDVATMANLAATAETLAATAYYGTLTQAGFSIPNDDRVYLALAMDSEIWHLEVLESLGGRALAQEFYIPEKFLTDFRTNVQTFIAAETAFIGAYLAATRRFAELNLPRLAGTTAQHAGTEVEHLALTRLIGGFVPNPNALPAPIYYNVSDAVPTLAPFLRGGPGFIGPVKFPGKDAVRALAERLGGKSVRVPPYTNVF
ncbi:hypothetical protein [Kallotenue papyrolyticum]|uniref:hypothetical protein n=1 Tax=Kallotenue papyrolyticum TaxID=1325125 RepID=UPI000471F293|nr:hypothetical protein [Kallotenue papyrolyticum]